MCYHNLTCIVYVTLMYRNVTYVICLTGLM